LPYPNFAFQFPNDPVALGEWFVASVALVVVVTLVYIFVLNRRAPPAEVTSATAQQVTQPQVASAPADPSTSLTMAQQALQSGDNVRAVEYSVQTVESLLEGVARGSGAEPKYMNITDLAYLIQARSPSSSPQFAPSVYQLNSLRLKALQGQVVTQQEASWAVQLAAWVGQLTSSGRVH
jgi:hypothetical protein